MANRYHRILLITFLVLSALAVQAQEEKETWYVWIDTYVEIEGEQYRIVSDEPFAITCCVKSPKYRKLGKSAEKWIKANVSKQLKSNTVLRNIQDLNLANTMVAQAKNKADAGAKVKMVKYSASCD